MCRVLKEATESAWRIFAGREFQSFGPAYEMDFLKISSLGWGTKRRSFEDDEVVSVRHLLEFRSKIGRGVLSQTFVHKNGLFVL